MSTSDQQTSNTLMKTRADKAFTMEPISFTNLVCGNILCYQEHCQLDPNEEAHYPKVKEVARSKP
jgi:hypothetical protein